jgi:hypothetical protein
VRSIPWVDRQALLHDARRYFRVRPTQGSEKTVKRALGAQHVVQSEIIDTGTEETCDGIGGRFRACRDRGFSFAMRVPRNVD